MEGVFLVHQKILNRNKRCALEEENVEMTRGLQEQFVFRSWVLWGKKKSNYFHGWLFCKWMYFQGRGWKKGRQILTALKRKTHAEAKQQNLSRLCTVKYCVQLVHLWTDVLHLLPLRSYLCALNTRGWLLHLSAFALLFPLLYLPKSADNETIIAFTE